MGEVISINWKMEREFQRLLQQMTQRELAAILRWHRKHCATPADTNGERQ